MQLCKGWPLDPAEAILSFLLLLLIGAEAILPRVDLYLSFSHFAEKKKKVQEEPFFFEEQKSPFL